MVARLPFVRLRPRADSFYVSQGRTVFETDAEGWIPEGGAHGLFVYQTRLLSQYRWLVDGAVPRTVALSNVEQHSSLGYYICPPGTAADAGATSAVDVNEHTVELRVSRYVGGGVHEDIDVTNYSGWPVSLRLTLEVDADFAGPGELYGESGRVRGKLDRRWNATVEGDRWTLVFEYRAEHAFDRQGNQGVARLDRGLTLESIERARRLVGATVGSTSRSSSSRWRPGIPVSTWWRESRSECWCPRTAAVRSPRPTLRSIACARRFSADRPTSRPRARAI